jgi:conjugative transfer region lipoprotein (TIGR03751 family)
MRRQTRMARGWTNFTVVSVGVTLTLLATGCATRKEKLLPHGRETMLDVWTQNTAGSLAAIRPSRILVDARASLRRPLDAPDREAAVADTLSYTRNAQNEVDRLFVRLPNPDLVMYVFPHLAGDRPVPVPGYSTVFPFYQQVQYALPGERTESY